MSDSAMRKAPEAIGMDNGCFRVVRNPKSKTVVGDTIQLCMGKLKIHFGDEKWAQGLTLCTQFQFLAGEHFDDLVCFPELWWDEEDPEGRPEYPMGENDLDGAANNVFLNLSYPERTLLQGFFMEAFDSENGLDLLSCARELAGGAK